MADFRIVTFRSSLSALTGSDGPACKHTPAVDTTYNMKTGTGYKPYLEHLNNIFEKAIQIKKSLNWSGFIFYKSGSVYGASLRGMANYVAVACCNG